MKDPIIETTTEQLCIELQVRSYTLSDALARCPCLADALRFGLNFYNRPNVADSDFGRGLLFETAQLPGLGLEQWAPYGILLKLPDELEELATEMAANGPDIMNLCTVDMLHKLTLGVWSAGDTRVCIVVEALYDIVELCQSYDHERSLRPVVHLPVIIVAGQKLVINTYVTGENWDLELQGAGIGSGCNWNPWRLYDESTMALAAEREKQFGKMPWRDQLFRYPHNDLPEVSTKRMVWMSVSSWFRYCEQP